MSCARPFHLRPVHLNRGKAGSIWLCLECGIQLGGPTLPLSEIKILKEFALHLSNVSNSHKAKEKKKMTTQDLIGAHANGLKSSIHALEVQVTILKQLVGGKVSAAIESEEDGSESEDDDDAPPAKPARANSKKQAAANDEDDDDGEPAAASPAMSDEGDFGESEEEEEENETPPAKTAKPKTPKLTHKDANAASHERCGRTNRAEVLALMKKKFKIKSVQELKDDQLAEFIKVMKTAPVKQ